MRKIDLMYSFWDEESGSCLIYQKPRFTFITAFIHAYRLAKSTKRSILIYRSRFSTGKVKIYRMGYEIQDR